MTHRDQERAYAPSSRFAPDFRDRAALKQQLLEENLEDVGL